jgi:hypothetical protein
MRVESQSALFARELELDRISESAGASRSGSHFGGNNLGAGRRQTSLSQKNGGITVAPRLTN